MKFGKTITLAISLVLIAGGVLAQQATKVQVKLTDTQGNLLNEVEAFWFHNNTGVALSQVDGAFQVEPRGLIVVHRNGFQYSGMLLNESMEPDATLKLLRDDEEARAKSTLPMPLDDDTCQRFVNGMNARFWAKLEGKPDMRTLIWSLQFLAKTQPEKVLEYLQENESKLPQQAMSVRMDLIKKLAKTDLDLAIEASDSVKQPMFQCSMLYSLIKNVEDESIRESLEEQWIESIKAVPQPQLRMAMFASLAEHYQNSGRADLAKPIVEEFLPDVGKLPAGGWSGYPRSLFAALIVNEDPDQALKLIEGIDENEKNRALGRVAFHAGRSNPELAVALLDRMEFSENTITLATYHQRVVYRMAGEQTEAALEIARSISEPNQRAWNLATVAMRLQDTDKPLAAKSLSEAVEILSQIDLKRPAKFLRPSETLGGMLPVAETVMPEAIDSMIWQMVWMMMPRSRWTSSATKPEVQYQNVAAMIARYDRELGLAIAGSGDLVVGSDPERAVMNAASLRGDQLMETIQRFEQANRSFSSSFRPSEKLAGLMNANPEAFWNAISKPSFLNWPMETFEGN